MIFVSISLICEYVKCNKIVEISAPLKTLLVLLLKVSKFTKITIQLNKRLDKRTYSK